MIVRNRRKRRGLFDRLARKLSRIKPPAGHRMVLSDSGFQREIDKEIHRSNRRSTDPEFAVVSMDFCDHEVPDEKLELLIEQFQSRLRVSDTIGWHRMKLAALLPETGREGAELVCDSLLEIANDNGIELKTKVSVYPWDDFLRGPYADQQDFRQSSLSFEKGSNGSHHWRTFAGGNDLFSNVSDFGSGDSRNGVATLTAPAKNAKANLRTTGGTGIRLAFSPSKTTPVWKRSIDVAGAGFGLLALSPLFLAVAVAVKLTSKGPVFFRQQREGKDGEVFHILKFRTMCQDAEAQKDELRIMSEQDGPAFKLKNDPRLTRVGRYLRKSCIDEMPQLLNVLTGQMSLVGPRPLPVNESQKCLPWQRQRLTVLPGLTCTWQARGGRDVKFAEWMRMDLDYIENRSFWYDMRLIGETALVVAMHKGSV